MRARSALLSHQHSADCVQLPVAAACGLLPVACCLWPAACGLLPVACCLWPAACGLLPMACCLWPAAYGLLPVACCLWALSTCQLAASVTAGMPCSVRLAAGACMPSAAVSGLVAWTISESASTPFSLATSMHDMPWACLHTETDLKPPLPAQVVVRANTYRLTGSSAHVLPHLPPHLRRYMVAMPAPRPAAASKPVLKRAPVDHRQL